VDEIDLRTDEWALASITWEMLSGRCPFTGEDVASLLYQIVHEDPPPLAATVPGLSPEVDEVLRMALAKRRENRFASVGAFARALESAILGSAPSYEPTPAPQPVPLSKGTSNTHLHSQTIPYAAIYGLNWPVVRSKDVHVPTKNPRAKDDSRSHRWLAWL